MILRFDDSLHLHKQCFKLHIGQDPTDTVFVGVVQGRKSEK